MATRMYMRAATTAPASPSFSASWTNTTSSDRRYLAPEPLGSDTIAEGTGRSWTAGQVRLDRQYVSDPMRAGQTISGTVTSVLRCREGAADDNVVSRFGVRVVSADGATVRATLLAVGAHGSQTEYINGVTGHIRQIANATALTSYTTQAGDRLVVEIGATDVTGTTPALVHFFGSSAAGDYPTTEGQPAVVANGWVEFSADFDFIDGSGVSNVAERGPDTLFFGYSATGTMTELLTDLSGEGNNFQDDVGIHDGTAYSDGGLPDAWSIDMAVLMNSTDTGYLYSRSYNGAAHHACVADGSGNLDFYVEGALAGTVTPPSLSATSQLVLMNWSMEPNPLTTGVSDTRRHDVRVYNADTGEWDGTSFLTATPTDNPGLQETCFAVETAGGAEAYSNTFRMVRLSSHWHPPKELERCFLDVSAAPTPYGVTRVAWPLIRHTDAAWADDGYFAGPPHIWAAKSTHRNDLRLWGPLVNEVYTGNADTADETWIMADLDDGSHNLHLSTLRRRPVPPGCDRIRVRFFLEHAAGSGRVTIRSYVSDRPGWLVQPSPSPNQMTYEYQETGNIAAGTSAWHTLSHTIAPRDADGYVYHWLAADDSDPASSFTIHAVSVEPVLYSGNEG